MQELMLRHKTTTFSPRDCLKTILHQRWSKTCSDNRPVPKTRRKRKNAPGTDPLPAAKDSPTNNGPTPTKKRSTTNQLNTQPSAQEMTNVPGVISFSWSFEEKKSF